MERESKLRELNADLEKLNPYLANEAKKVLEHNKEERHIRGGMATKLKYQSKKLKMSN